MRATDMNDIPDPARDRDSRLESFAAELTSAVYPVVLRRSPKSSWLKVELALWKALTKTVKRWARQRPAAVPSDEFEARRQGLLVDLTASAFSVAVRHGIKGAFLEVQLGLYRAFRAALRRKRGRTPV